MKYCLRLLIYLGFLGASNLDAQQANWLWTRGGGGKGNDASSSVAADSAGNIYVTGYYVDSAVFSGTALQSPKGNHLFIAKYSPIGSLAWIKTTGVVTGQSQGTGINISVDNFLYVTGYFSDSIVLGPTVLTSAGIENIFLAKYDLNGVPQWAESGGGPGYDQARAVCSDTSGNIYVTGNLSGVAKFGSKTLTSVGGDDIFILKYDPAGTIVWAKSFGSRIDDRGYGITVGRSGTIALTGFFSDTIDFGGTKLIAKGSSKGSSDIFIAKFSSDGNPLWAQQAGDTEVGKGQSIAMDADENVYVTGDFVGSLSIIPNCDGVGNIYIAKYSSIGVKQWMKCAGTGGEEFGTGVVVDSSSGSLYVTGGYDNTINFGNGPILNNGLFDAFIVKFDLTGVAQWTGHAGGRGVDEGIAVALDPNGNLYLSGIFSDTCTFGPFQVESSGSTDVFVAKIGTQSDVHGSNTDANETVSFYPNPAKNKITLEFISDAKEESISIEIVSLLGVPMRKITAPCSGTGKQVISLPIAGLPKGVYFYRILSNRNMNSTMIVVGD